MVCELIDLDTGKVVINRLEVATTFSQRFWGLQFRRSLAPGEGLLIAPCNSIHTCWMRFSITALFVDGDGKIMKVCPGLRPWRATYPAWGAKCVIELPAECDHLQPGDRLGLRFVDSSACPQNLRRLVVE
jgi:uncharacterized membrane protein (UPF0127 family)